MFRTIAIGILLVTLTGAAQAALSDRGGGMIYDDVLDITWLQNANLGGSMSWGDSVAWADGLVFGGFDDWRLPSMDLDLDGTIVNCSSASEADCRDNELGYMFYHNLMGSLGLPLIGDQGLIENIQSQQWSGTAFSDPVAAYYLLFLNGANSIATIARESGAWAVRDGDIDAVPLPAGIWLLGSALLAVAGLGNRRRRG